jgi:hypothetical protein
MSSSLDAINYAVRPNKNVERKLIVELVGGLRDTFGIEDYRYIGLGGNTFVDFNLAHRNLGINELISIERDEAERAAFNSPYQCITVIEGESTVVLPTLPLSNRRAVVWMDYDDSLYGSAAIDDANILGRELPSGSVFIITVNAQNNQFDDDDVVCAKPGDRGELRLRSMQKALGNLVPLELPENPMGANTFPQVAGQILCGLIAHAVISAARLDGAEFLPLFNLTYSDGARMVTVGGMIAAAEEANLLRTLDISRFAYARGAEQVAIDVPPLTLKEKWAIDCMLPTNPALTDEALRERFNFSPRPSQLGAYCTYYKYYPIYSELFG